MRVLKSVLVGLFVGGCFYLYAWSRNHGQSGLFDLHSHDSVWSKTLFFFYLLLVVWVTAEKSGEILEKEPSYDGKEERKRDIRIAKATGALTIGLAIVFSNLNWTLVADYYKLAAGAIGLHRLQLLFGSAVCGAGFGAHKFKQRKQWLYGFVEVWIGGLSCFAISLSMSPEKLDLARWASLIGAGYVIARGLNNMSDANKKRDAAVSEAKFEAVSVPPASVCG